MEKAAVIGVGKLGLCFALQLEKAGYEVLGVDANEDYVHSINNKTFQSSEPGVNEALLFSQHFRVTHQFKMLLNFNPEIIFIAVATPASKTNGYDHSLVNFVLQSLYSLKISSVRIDVVIMCTTLPGYCDTKAEEALEHNIFISYKPEFIAQGSIMRNLQYPDVILIGEADKYASDKITLIHSKINLSKPTLCCMNRLSAEITKLAVNCYLSMKISFANAIGDLSEKVGAQTNEILSAIGFDTRIGNKFLNYGFGYGGPCFPRDNRALNYYARQNGTELFLSAATEQANTYHLDFQFKKYMNEYSDNDAIYFNYITYKPGTILLEESQQLALAVMLAEAGRKVIIHEKNEVIIELRKLFGDLFIYDFE